MCNGRGGALTNEFGAIKLPSGGNLLTTETSKGVRFSGHAGALVGGQLFSVDTEIVLRCNQRMQQKTGLCLHSPRGRRYYWHERRVETKLGDGLSSVGAGLQDSEMRQSDRERFKEQGGCTKLQRPSKERRRERSWMEMKMGADGEGRESSEREKSEEQGRSTVSVLYGGATTPQGSGWMEFERKGGKGRWWCNPLPYWSLQGESPKIIFRVWRRFQIATSQERRFFSFSDWARMIEQIRCDWSDVPRAGLSCRKKRPERERIP
ncbi:hypothetical protein BDW62DRAFT_141952 [Aspergillus aurantiobrunneus]